MKCPTWYEWIAVKILPCWHKTSELTESSLKWSRERCYDFMPWPNLESRRVSVLSHIHTRAGSHMSHIKSTHDKLLGPTPAVFRLSSEKRTVVVLSNWRGLAWSDIIFVGILCNTDFIYLTHIWNIYFSLSFGSAETGTKCTNKLLRFLFVLRVRMVLNLHMRSTLCNIIMNTARSFIKSNDESLRANVAFVAAWFQHF